MKFKVGDWVRWVGVHNPKEELKREDPAHIAQVLEILPRSSGESYRQYKLLFPNIAGTVLLYGEKSLRAYKPPTPDWEI